MSVTGQLYHSLRRGREFGALLLTTGILTVVAGCGGGGSGGGGTPPVSPTITSVSVSCSPTSILTTQTSTCTPTVNGTGSFSSSVTWSVSPTSMGTVTSAGVFTPAGTGTATIIATSTEDSTKSGSTPIAVTNPQPAITSLSPTSATAGVAAQTLTINGTGFVSISTVSFNGVAHTATFVSATQLTISLSVSDQATAGTYAVVVTNPSPGGGASNSFSFTVNNPAPTISGLSPTPVIAGAGAQTLTINGTGFVSISTVSFNGVAHTTTFVSATQLTISLSVSDQATPGTYAVVVTNPTPGGGASGPRNFIVGNSSSGYGEWTWVSGSSTGGATGVYGSLGVPSASNVPGERLGAANWTDGKGNLWLFGGYANVAGTDDFFNDLWEYSPTTKTWTWVSGANTPNQVGVYGTQGAPATTNVPGARYCSASWIDGNGNLWLFGGRTTLAGNDVHFNDLWEFNPTAKTWTWVSGTNTTNSTGVYGTQGTPATTNVPGARDSEVNWIDGKGDLWLFGGFGVDSAGDNGYLNDLWEFNSTAKTWTWVTGANTSEQAGVYGTQGTSATTNVPGARFQAVGWTDSNGNLWLFGGYAEDLTGNDDYFNDLWEFNPTAKTWTWVNGPNTINQTGVYGTQGTPSTTNVPGARDSAVSWIDSNNNFWLFGGRTTLAANNAYFNDIWEFNPTAKTWTWVNGADVTNQAGVYGTQGTTATTNVPGAREYTVGWNDGNGNSWLFGGEGVDSTGIVLDLNDLWRYQLPTAPASTITSVIVSCSTVSVPTGQTNQCSATVSGTGSYNSAVNWSVNNISGGNSTIGTIGPTGIYSAPATVPTPFTVNITGTSVEDSTKAASVSVIVAGTIASVSQPIVAASGGTITLPDGSSVTIAPGSLPSNQTVTLSEVSYLPTQPPNLAITGVGPGLVLTFGTPIAPLAEALRTRNDSSASRELRSSLTSTANTTTSAFQFSINTSNNSSSELNGSVPAVDFADTSGNNVFMGTMGNYTSTTAVVAGTIGTDQWTAFLVSTSNTVASIVVSAVNIVGYETSVGVRLLGVPNQLSLSINSSDSTKDSWVNYSTCPTGKTLIVVHGMNSYVQAAFPTDSPDMTIQQILTAGGYQAALGFNYDWTQHIDSSGSQLAQFLNLVATCTAVTSIDIEAHSEGVPVSMAAWIPSAGLTSSAKAKIDHLIALGGPIMGTPMANDARWLGAFIMGASELDLGDNIVLDGLADLLTRPFVSDLQVSSPGDGDVLDDIRQSLSPASIQNMPQVVAVAGNAPQSPLLKTLANSMSVSPYNVVSSDGFIPVASALAFQTGVVEGQELKTYPLAPFPVEHTNLVTDLNDNSTTGIFKSVGAQVNNALVSPSLAISSSSSCSDVVVCSDAPEAIFEMSGNGYSTTQNDEFELFTSGIVNSPPNPPPTFTAPNGSIPVYGWTDSTTCPMPPRTVVFFAENMSTLRTSNAVIEEVNSGSCITSNPTPSIALLSPSSLLAGSPSQTLTIEGTGFIPLSTVTFNGIAHNVTYVGTNVLTISLTSTDLEMAGTYPVMVTNPAPVGGPSNSVALTVTALPGSVSISPSSATIPIGAVQTFLATVAGGGSVNWSIEEGSSGGAVTTAGIYSAPNHTGTYHVIATNASNSSQSATSVVSVVSGPSIKTLHSFNHSTEGAVPWAAPIFGSDGDMYGVTEAGGDLSCAYISSLAGCGTIYKSDTSGDVTTLHSFAGTDGAYPGASLIATANATFYGTTQYGGSNTTACDASGTSIPAGCGSVFSYSASSGFTSILSFGPFNSPIGVGPEAPLVQTTNGTLYGTNQGGGNTTCTGTVEGQAQSGCGAIFNINTSNVPSALHTFSGSEGAYPAGGLLLQSDGNFYGTTSAGGALTCSSFSTPGCGTVFQMTSLGAIKTLHFFTAQDGALPEASLILGADGNMYGTTIFGGITTCSGGAQWQGCGTVFKIDTSGNFTSLHSFSGPDGAYPTAIMQAADGYFYGTTEGGGDAACSGRYGSGCGTVFRMDSVGNVTVLYSFTGKSDGSWPESGVTQGTDGNLYGTTAYGGMNDDGVIFQLSNLTSLTPSAMATNDLRNDRPAMTPVLTTNLHVGRPGPPVSRQP